jgi:hypothetical protein
MTLVGCVELRNRTGKGVAILIEGEKSSDALYYRQWFSNMPVAFFPQGNWLQVIGSVASLRQNCPDIPIYGIIDRDFADESMLDSEFATKGIRRTSHYTLENYLLEPDCWAEVFKFVFSDEESVPQQWDNQAQVQQHIMLAFRECWEIAAYNWVVHHCYHQFGEVIRSTKGGERKYYDHPNALANQNPIQLLEIWEQQCGFPTKLKGLYTQKLAEFEKMQISDWHKHISGKYVLKVFHNMFPRRSGRGQIDLDLYLKLYLRDCRKPQELTQLIDRIIAHARL